MYCTLFLFTIKKRMMGLRIISDIKFTIQYDFTFNIFNICFSDKWTSHFSAYRIGLSICQRFILWMLQKQHLFIRKNIVPYFKENIIKFIDAMEEIGCQYCCSWKLTCEGNIKLFFAEYSGKNCLKHQKNSLQWRAFSNVY